MTIEEITLLAMERAAEVTAHYPMGRMSAYRRIGIRERQLVQRASAVNPELYGTSATADLDVDKAADFMDIADPVPTPDVIQRITIETLVALPSENPPAVGDEINLVSITDPDAGLPPRATLRDLILRPVGTELADVASIRVWYPKLTPDYGPTDGDTEAYIAAPHDELLVVDLAKVLLARATKLDAGTRTATLAQLDAEEAGLLAMFDRYVAEYGPWQRRFTAAS